MERARPHAGYDRSRAPYADASPLRVRFMPRPRKSWSSSAAASSARAAPLRRPAASSVCGMSGLEPELDSIASKTEFSGVVRIDRADRIELREGLRPCAPWLRDPQHGRYPVRDRERLEGPDGARGGEPDRGRPARAVDAARSVLGEDLPLIDDDVTVEHLLSHRRASATTSTRSRASSSADYLMPVPVHELATTEDYLAVLDGHPTSSHPASASPTATAATSCSP